MTTSNWEIISAEVLAEEGGYVNDPHDPGGETNYGISKRAYPRVDIKHLTKADAVRIYHSDYWSPIRGDLLPSGVDVAVMDYAVNSGVSRAIKCLQSLVKQTQDGILGSHTLDAAADYDPAYLAGLICDARLAFLSGLPTWKMYNVGWKSRIARVRKLALSLATQHAASTAAAPIPPAAPPKPAATGFLAALRSFFSRF